MPIISETAKRSMKMPLWNMLKLGAVPWALDQFSDIMGPDDLRTQEPDSVKSPNDGTTATLDLNEQIEKDITTSSNLPSNPPDAAGNVNLNDIEASTPDLGDGDAGDVAGAGEDEDDSGQQKLLYEGSQDLDAGTIFANNDSLTEVKLSLIHI